MRLRCRIGWHDWAKWGEPLYQRAEKVFKGGSSDVTVLSQNRGCPDCGLAARRERIVDPKNDAG